MSENDLDIPFHEHERQHLTGPVNFSGGVIVSASVVELEDARMPALIFKFAKAEGGFYDPICLVTDDDQMGKLRTLINSAVGKARTAAQS
jgi:hypothetical protein